MISYPDRIGDTFVRNKLRELIDALNKNDTEITANTVAVKALAPPLTLAQIQQAIQLGGSNPINITGLQGILANPQIAVASGTHAQRLATPAVLGTGFYETDRSILYVGVLVSNAAAWVYAGGTFAAALSALPGDLTTGDKGFSFLAIDTITEYGWSGAAWITDGGLYQVIQNAATGSVTDIFILQHLLNNLAGANGMGVGQLAQLVDSAKATVDGSRVSTVITDATAATFTTKLVIQLRNAGAALADYFAVLVTDIRFKVGGFFGILTHANSADRTYTLPNATSNIVYETTALSTNLLVVGRTIPADSGIITLGTSGTEHTVLHGSTAGVSVPTWSAVDVTADITGVLPKANGGSASSAGAAVAGVGPTPGTYVTGLKLTGGGNNGSITINADGQITAITAAS